MDDCFSIPIDRGELARKLHQLLVSREEADEWASLVDGLAAMVNHVYFKVREDLHCLAHEERLWETRQCYDRATDARIESLSLVVKHIRSIATAVPEELFEKYVDAQNLSLPVHVEIGLDLQQPHPLFEETLTRVPYGSSLEPEVPLYCNRVLVFAAGCEMLSREGYFWDQKPRILLERVMGWAASVMAASGILDEEVETRKGERGLAGGSDGEPPAWGEKPNAAGFAAADKEEELSPQANGGSNADKPKTKPMRTSVASPLPPSAFSAAPGTPLPRPSVSLASFYHLQNQLVEQAEKQPSFSSQSDVFGAEAAPADPLSLFRVVRLADAVAERGWRGFLSKVTTREPIFTALYVIKPQTAPLRNAGAPLMVQKDGGEDPSFVARNLRSVLDRVRRNKAASRPASSPQASAPGGSSPGVVRIDETFRPGNTGNSASFTSPVSDSTGGDVTSRSSPGRGASPASGEGRPARAEGSSGSTAQPADNPAWASPYTAAFAVDCYENFPMRDLGLVLPGSTVTGTNFDAVLFLLRTLGFLALLREAVSIVTSTAASGEWAALWTSLLAQVSSAYYDESVRINWIYVVCLFSIFPLAAQIASLASRWTNHRSQCQSIAAQYVAQKRLSSGPSAISFVATASRDQELNTLLLAYYTLWQNGPMDSKEWTTACQEVLLDNFALASTFDVGHAIPKLMALKMIEPQGRAWIIALQPTAFLNQSTVPWTDYAKLVRAR